MKALSIRQPWASLIVAGIKDVENRTWATKLRGPLAIHAGLYKESRGRGEVYDAMMAILCPELPDPLPRGGIIGTVDLVDVVQDSESEWAEDGQYHWLLANPQPLDFVPVRGRLGLFNVEAQTTPKERK